MTKARFSFFGTSLYLRPQEETLRSQCLVKPVQWSIEEARKKPDHWQCLIMKRNYADYAWDSVGGNNNEGEFPHQTLEREVKEELGWKIIERVEVCRQWRNGALEGFVYVCKPNEEKYLHDQPPRILCHEVAQVRYFDLMEIINSSEFKTNIKGRIAALIKGESDFNL